MAAPTPETTKAMPALKPVMIGDIHIETPLMLAPMAGHSNYALRTLCRDFGDCGLVYTEFLSSKALARYGAASRGLDLFGWRESEAPIAVQLFGSDPDEMAEAARVVVDHGATLVDINMGCWVPKIVKKGAGAALLRDVCTATAVVEAVVEAVDVPVTVKVRSGFEDGVVTAVPFARAAERAGVQAVAVHARFAQQGRKGDADWDVIRQVKQAVSTMPVIGNGDVETPEDAMRMLDETGCDAVMIGRAALGQPWIFEHVAHYLRTGEHLPPPTRAERAACALHHARLTLETTALPLRQAVLELRGQLSKYRLDAPGSVMVRNRIVRAETLDDIEAILSPVIADAYDD